MTAVAVPTVGAPRHKLGSAARAIRAHWFLPTILTSDAALLSFTEAHHEPWFDEAQAWLIARDSSITELFAHRLRYEGSPGLWHLLLMIPAKLGLPYGSIGVISVTAALCGALIVLTRSPFSRPIQALICFSFFPFFQYGVVARNYCLLGPLLFLLAAMWRDKMRHPARLTLLLALLANVSLHGFLIAAALASLHAIDLRRTWSSLEANERRRQRRSLIALAVVAATVLVELFPQRDVSGGGYWHLTTPLELIQSDMLLHQPVVTLMFLAVAVISVRWFQQRRCLLLFALPMGLLLFLFLFRYFSPWHAGTIFLVWIFALWVSLDRRAEDAPHAPRLRRLMLTATATLLVTQVAWTLGSVRFDWLNSYSGSAAVAAYIKTQHLENERIDIVGKWAAAILPYFSRDIFYNYSRGRGPSYYNWSSTHPSVDDHIPRVLGDDPDVIIVATKSRQGRVPLPCLDGYLEKAFFAGGIYLPWTMESEDFTLYTRAPVHTPAPGAGCGHF